MEPMQMAALCFSIVAVFVAVLEAVYSARIRRRQQIEEASGVKTWRDPKTGLNHWTGVIDLRPYRKPTCLGTEPGEDARNAG